MLSLFLYVMALLLYIYLIQLKGEYCFLSFNMWATNPLVMMIN